MYFPEEAGYPMGDDNYPDYFVMEMHYDNPKLLSGRRDSSGKSCYVLVLDIQYTCRVL